MRKEQIKTKIVACGEKGKPSFSRMGPAWNALGKYPSSIIGICHPYKLTLQGGRQLTIYHFDSFAIDCR